MADASTLPTGLINRLLNGAFALCPEGTQTVGDGATAFVNYTVLTQSGNVTTSQLSVPEPGQATAIQILQASATAQRFGLCQTIVAADCQDLRTNPLNGQHRAKFSQATGYRTMFALLEFDGSADTSPVDPIADWNSTLYVPGQFFKSNFTVLNYGYLAAAQATWASAPYIPYQANTGLNNLVYVVWTELPVPQNGTLALGLWQVAKGPTPQVFEYRPKALEEVIDEGDVTFTSINMPDGDQSITVDPVGNPSLPTLTSVNLEGETRAANEREFLVNIGFTSNKGSGGTGNAKDKVALYAGIDMEPGSGDGWALNTVTEVSSGVGSFNVHGYELDLNNNNQNYGTTAGSGGLAAPTCFGLSIDGFSAFNCTGAILINQSGGAGVWHRGITIALGSVDQSGLENYAAMTDLIRNYGSPTYVLRSDTASMIEVGGLAAFGTTTVAGIALNVAYSGALLASFAGTTSATLRWADWGAGSNLKFMDANYDGGVLNLLFLNDNGSTRVTPFGIDTTGANPIIRCATDNLADLGATGLRWRSIYGYNIDAKTAFSLPGGVTWSSGSGSPEGVVSAPVGSLYSRTNGGAGTSLYVKESGGSGNTGWVGK